MSLAFNCPICGERIVVRYLKVGETALCRSCGSYVQVPTTATTTDEDSTLIDTPLPEATRGATTKPRKPYPGFLQAVGLLMLILLGSFLLGIINGFLALLWKHVDGVLIPFCTHLIIALGVWIGYRKTKASLREVFPIGPFPMIMLIPLLVTFFGVAILRFQLIMVIKTLYPLSNFMEQEWVNMVRKNFLLGGVYIIIIGPVLEELLFRGVFLYGFLRRYSTTRAIFLSSLLFGLFHLIPVQVINSFLLGLLLAWWYIRIGSIRIAILGHVLNNLIAFAILLWINDKCIFIPGRLIPVYLAVSCLGLIIALVGVLLTTIVPPVRLCTLPTNPKAVTSSG